MHTWNRSVGVIAVELGLRVDDGIDADGEVARRRGRQSAAAEEKNKHGQQVVLRWPSLGRHHYCAGQS
jgi:hypothetical protein